MTLVIGIIEDNEPIGVIRSNVRLAPNHAIAQMVLSNIQVTVTNIGSEPVFIRTTALTLEELTTIKLMG